MEKRLFPWLVACFAIVSATLILILFLSVWTIVLLFVDDGGTSFPDYMFVPYIIMPLLAVIPLVISIVVELRYFKIDSPSKEQTKKVFSTVFWLHLSTLIYISIQLLFYLFLYFSKVTILSLGISHMTTPFSYSLVTLLFAIYPGAFCIVLKTNKITNITNDSRDKRVDDFRF